MIAKGPEHDSKVAALKAAQGVAARFLDGVEIYFPHTMDWRGRLYPVPIGLNPQGDDAVRALLTFADGKPITTLEQAQCLAIPGANCYGIDKVSFAERLRWVEENVRMILGSAASPLENREWSKADEPWQFLAFCFEWAAFQREGFGFVSSVPVAMDGTCNGLQHFSAMLRDEQGGSAVTLTPSEAPQDIYQRVADRVSEILSDRNDAMAQMWLGVGITRNLVKQPVMTLPYGATSSGRRDSIREEVGWKASISGKAVSYLEKVVKQAIDETVKAAPEAMRWLQDIARVMSKRDLPVQWTTPAGLEVMMLEIKRRSVEVRSRGKRLRYLQEVEPKPFGPPVIDGRAAVQGIAANFIHSLDAAHLMLTVNASVALGVRSFAMVHDSYGTVAADAPVLARVLREAFVGMYEQHDPLAELRDRVLAHDVTLPPLPESGRLAIERVRDAKYFFA